MREVERRVVLSVLDRKWREHLYEMDYLQEGIGLRAMAQRDPLVEYQREGFLLFEAMMDGIKEESVAYLFSLEVTAAEPEQPQVGLTPVAVGDLVGGLVGGPGGGPQDGGTAELDGGLDEASDGDRDDAGEPATVGAPADEAGHGRRPVIVAKGLEGGPSARRLTYSAPSDGGGVEQRVVDDVPDGADPSPKRRGKKAKRRGR